MGAVNGDATGANSIAVTGTATGGSSIGVQGKGDAVGVWGDGKTWHGVVGLSESTTGGFGVYGKNSAGGTGVVGESDGWMGVYGKSASTSGGAGVMGEGDPGPGVVGKSTKWIGVYGEAAGLENGPAGVWGEHKGAGVGIKAVSKDGAGLAAYSTTGEAVHAETHGTVAAVSAYNLNAAGDGFAVFGKKEGPGGFAGFFDGHVWVSGNLSVGTDVILTGADCAEDFDIAEAVEPGTVMVLCDDGTLRPSAEAYDKRVVGVVSGAGSHRPGIILDKKRDKERRSPIALVGKVFCRVDASSAPIDVGDLLTTAATLGCAMKATDAVKAFGAVIGKALRPWCQGQGLIPILVALQ